METIDEVRVTELRAARERIEAQAQVATATLSKFNEWAADRQASMNFRGAAASLCSSAEDAAAAWACSCSADAVSDEREH